MDSLVEAKEHFLSALSLQEKGELVHAETEYRKALELAPERPSVMNNLATVLLQLDKHTEARDLCERLLVMNPRDPLALINLGHCQIKHHAPDEALASYQAALEIVPESVDTHLSRGHALLQLMRPQEALASYERALALKPDSAEAHVYRGRVLTDMGRLAEAAEALSAAAAGMSNRADVHTDLGMVLTYLGRHEEAAAHFGQARDLDPENPDGHLNLGSALAEQGKAAEALACYKKIRELSPGSHLADFSTGKLYERLGELDRAIESYRDALSASPAHPDILHSLGRTYEKQGRDDDAASCYRRILFRDRSNVTALNSLGSLLKNKGQVEEAVRLFDRAVDSDPKDPLGYLNLGQLRGEQGRHAEACTLLEKAASLAPRESPMFINIRTMLAEIRLFQLEFERAWTDFEGRIQRTDDRKSVRGDPRTIDLYQRLPHWKGRKEAGIREVAVWAEQGIGDQILYSSLLPELAETGISFVYEVDPRLIDAYCRAFPGIRFVAFSEPPVKPLQTAERVLLAGSLPSLFRSSRDDFARQPKSLFRAIPDRVARYRARLDTHRSRTRIALSWHSKNVAGTGQLKSASLMELRPLITQPGVQLVDAQYGDTLLERRGVEDATGVKLAHFDEVDYYNDLEGVLAILEACDLVITTSNVTAHLAGALGKRTWLLDPADRAPFFYWAHGGGFHSLWYPSVEIVTAPELDAWPALAKHAAIKLQKELT